MTDADTKLYVHATSNQQNSKTSVQFELTKPMLSQLLGWRQDGRGVEEIDTLLHEGVGVEVRHAMDGATYRLVPFVGELAEGDVPTVDPVVVRRVAND